MMDYLNRLCYVENEEPSFLEYEINQFFLMKFMFPKEFRSCMFFFNDSYIYIYLIIKKLLQKKYFLN